jgi:16S rRNA (cytosine967-C5)-methyltransferase
MTDVFKQGFFEVQDANQLVAAFLDVKPGMRVVDTCAGAGGKTLHGSFDGKQRTTNCYGFIRK